MKNMRRKPEICKRNRRVLLIDVGDGLYFRYFSKAMREKVNLMVITKYDSSDQHALHFFYRISDRMKDGRVRNLIRGIEYIEGYLRIFNYVKKNHFDIIHIQWAILPQFDVFFWKILKNYTRLLVYTAHDVVPHDYSHKRIMQNKKLYHMADKIVVHGQYCKEEMRQYYPDLLDRVYVQKHGVYGKKNDSINNELLCKHSSFAARSYEKYLVIGFIGQISNYKGFDLLLDAWDVLDRRGDMFLLIAGKTACDLQDEIEQYRARIDTYNNVYFYNYRFTDEEEMLFYSKCDLIILPYRSASMSGVLFSAAQYEKTVISTRVGCLGEYLEMANGNVYMIEPEKESIIEGLIQIAHYPNAKVILSEKGKKFSSSIYKECSWGKITDGLVRDCYGYIKKCMPDIGESE